MTNDLPVASITGKSYRLRPVCVADSELMLELRNDPVITRFIPPLPISIDQQKIWVRGLEGRTDDFMFAIETTDGARVEGFVGVYKVGNGQGEWGRWVLREGSKAGFESALLVHHWAFSTLNLSRLLCKVIVENERVVAFHERFGARRIGFIEKAISIRGHAFDMIEFELIRQVWIDMAPQFADRLTPAAP